MLNESIDDLGTPVARVPRREEQKRNFHLQGKRGGGLLSFQPPQPNSIPACRWMQVQLHFWIAGAFPIRYQLNINDASHLISTLFFFLFFSFLFSLQNLLYLCSYYLAFPPPNHSFGMFEALFFLFFFLSCTLYLKFTSQVR